MTTPFMATAEACWEFPHDAMRAIAEELEDDPDVAPGHTPDELDAINFLCACIAIAEAIRR